MALQNNGKTDKIELTPEEQALLDTPIPDDAEIEDKDKVDDVIEDPENQLDEEEEAIIADEEETKEELAETKAEEKTEPTDRYKEQRREAEILNEQRKNMVDALAKAETLPEPTDDELKNYIKQKGGEWDLLSDFEKGLAKDNLIAQRKQAALNEGLKSIKDANEWASTVDTFLDEHTSKQTYKQLIGREDEFRQFAMKASHRGVGMEYLVPSFLFQVKEVAKKKGSLLLHGGGGQKPETPSEPGTVNDANEVARLRTSNPKEFRRLLRSGKIKLSAE